MAIHQLRHCDLIRFIVILCQIWNRLFEEFYNLRIRSLSVSLNFVFILYIFT